MLNEDRIILMTKMASYEKGEGRKNIKIGNYYRSDYISIQLLKAVVCGTVAFVLMLGLYILYNLEMLMQDLYKIDLLAFATNILIYYAVFVVAYGLLVYVGCTIRYALAKKNLKNYYNNLKKLYSLYGENDKGISNRRS